MVSWKFVVVDRDCLAGSRLARLLSGRFDAVHVTSLGRLGSDWPADCAFLVADKDGQLEDAIAAVKARGIFYPIIPFATRPSPKRLIDMIRHGTISYLDWPCSIDKLASVIDGINVTCAELFNRPAARVAALSLLKVPLTAAPATTASAPEGARHVVKPHAPLPTAVQIHREVRTTREGVAKLIKPARADEDLPVLAPPAKPAHAAKPLVYGPHSRNMN